MLEKIIYGGQTETEDYPPRAEKNVIDSNGTLIINHGRPTGGSDLSRKMALKHGRQLLHIDLNQMSEFEAASQINSWIEMQKVKTLYWIFASQRLPTKLRLLSLRPCGIDYGNTIRLRKVK